MQDPASPPELMRTCPTCRRPVGPGYKFCEACGTQITELSTCSKCGTQFIDPVKYCESCGAPVIPMGIPEPDDSAEYSEEENAGSVEDQTSERNEEEIPEPDTDALPEDNDEENIVPAEIETPHYDKEEIPEPDTDTLPEDNDEENIVRAEIETPHHDKEEIPEPDTDELLEQYGKEYDEDETLESYHEPKPPSPLHHEPKKPVMVPARQGRGSSGTVDDVLFLLDNGQAPVKPPVNRIKIIGGGIILITILAAVFFIGLPMITGNGGLSTDSNPPATETTPVMGPTTAGTIPPALTPTPASRALVPLPTQLVPEGQKLYFFVQKSPVTSKISVIFTGSAGWGSISSADIKVTHPDGSVATGTILPLKGVTELTLEGSKDTDRVEIIAKMSSGETYRVYDELVPLIR